MRFWHGLAIGLPSGALVTWLAVARPWHHAAPTTAPALVVADAGPAATPTGRRSRRGHHGARGEGEEGGDGPSDAPPPPLSAADHETVSRGPAIALPTRTIDLGSGGDDARALEPGEINDVIRRSSQPVLDCIESARAGAELRGEVRLQLLVGGDGRVSKVRISAPRWLIDHGLADCATGAARAWRFPATGAPTVVDAPFHID